MYMYICFDMHINMYKCTNVYTLEPARSHLRALRFPQDAAGIPRISPGILG